MTGRDLIKGSLRLIGAIAQGETLSATEQADALSVLNELIEAWSVDGMMLYATTREEFALTANQQVRTMGVGGNFNTTRPVKVQNVSVKSNDTEIPVEIITVDQWAQISNKGSSSTFPLKVYIEGTHPLERFNLWPIPTTSNNLVIYSMKQITAVTLSGEITLPPGYQRALRYNLAVELAPEYGKTPNELVFSAATESKADLKRQNTKPVYMTSDVLGLTSPGVFNILTGE